MRLGDFKPINRTLIADSRPASVFLEEEVQSFLKTIKGLRYLQMKYPTYTLEQAAKEYKYQVWAAYQYS